jgi:hypothetical protein
MVLGFELRAYVLSRQVLYQFLSHSFSPLGEFLKIPQ